jgi:hypothetical protein
MSDLYSMRLITAGGPVNLDDGDPFAVINEDGLFAAAARRIVERGPQQHGVTQVDYRLEPRLVQLVVDIYFANTSTFWEARRDLLGWLAPYASPALEVETSEGAIYRLDVAVEGEMRAGSGERRGQAQSVGIALVADDPTFYDPSAEVLTFQVGNLTGTPIPTPIPTPVGGSIVDSFVDVAYDGTWRSAPIVRIVGPLTDAVVANVTTGDKLDFAGVTIAQGDYYEIDTRYGRKTVVDSAGVNKIADLTADSDLATFAIEPGGVNTLRVTGAGGNGNTLVRITYYARYLGI